jgi:hypothetical protein
MSEHTKLWDSVCKTDPSQTKGFKRAGGFGGTAIKPYWLIRRATETFGPVGIGWGFRETENLISEGIWFSKVEMWYTLDGQKGYIEQWGATELKQSRKSGEFVDEEAAKKAVTDGLTKCLSYLGFAGDVHMGLFDDSKYVTERQQEENAANWVPRAENAIREATTQEKLDQIMEHVIKQSPPDDVMGRLGRMAEARLKEIQNHQAA